jgi:Amt family ammonium transporter
MSRASRFERIVPVLGLVVLGLVAGGGVSWGEEAAVAAAGAKPAEAPAISLADTLWVLIAAILVFFMQAGFGMVEAGFTRAKNSVNILFKNVMDFSMATVAFWIAGFAIMFGAGNGFMGLSGWFLSEGDGTFASLAWAHVPLDAKFFFQLVFAGTAATIVSGAMAERTRFTSYLVYSFVITLVLYPVVGHWIWGGGWLAALGMWDFAGSTVVHSVGGWFALVGAWVLGPRIGKYGPDRRARAIPGHNIPMAAIGVFILWLGWFGFNPGSTMAACESIGHIAVTTNMAAAAGGIAGTFVSWALFRKPDLSMALNGVLAGLVAITAPCAFVSIGSAAIIGGVAGVVVVLSVVAIDRILRVDDPVGAVSVHLVCGILGTLAVGLFAEDRFSPDTTGNGLLFGGGWGLLGAQALGVLAVGGWCVATGLALFGGVKALLGLRVSREEESRGLDVGEHGMESYGGFQIFVNQ